MNGRFFLFLFFIPSLLLGSAGIQGRGNTLLVFNERLKLLLDDKGAMLSLMDKATGEELLAKGRDPVLFRLVFTKSSDPSGGSLIFSSLQSEEVDLRIKKEQDRHLATIYFRKIGGLNINAVCDIFVRSNDPFLYFSILVEGEEPLILERIEFPIFLTRSPLGDKIEDDFACIPTHAIPSLYRVARWGVGYSVGAKQPGSLCAQFACYYDPALGFYTATRDDKGFPKRFEMRRKEEGIELFWQHLCYHPLRGFFRLAYEIACTTFRSEDEKKPTDWRDAANLYKRWAKEQIWCGERLIQRKDLPKCLKGRPVMILFDRRTQEGSTPYISWWFAHYWKRFASPYLTPIALFWGWEHVAPWVSPKYFPFYPSDEDFAEAVRIVREHKGCIYLYPSTYQWTLTYRKREDGSFEWEDLEEFERIAKPHAVACRDGSVFKRSYEWLLGGENANLCPGDVWTREWFSNIVGELAKRSADLVQLDQVVGGQWPLEWVVGEDTCFAESHGHPPGHGIWETECLQEQLKMLRRRYPSLGFNLEGTNEVFLHFGNGPWDYRDDQAFLSDRGGGEPAPVFAYLYHEYAPFYNHYYLHTPEGFEPAKACMMAYSIVTGKIPLVGSYIPLTSLPAILNGDFEVFSGETPVGWEKVREWQGRKWSGKAYQDRRVKHAGLSSLRLENESPSDIVQVSQNIPVDGRTLKAGETYRLKLWLRSEDVLQANNVIIGALDRNWQGLSYWSIPIPQRTDWVLREMVFQIPPGTSQIRLMLHLEGAGRAWFDDISLEVLGIDDKWYPVRRPETPLSHLFRQWMRVFAEGKDFLLFGEMLPPPPLNTQSVSVRFPKEETLPPLIQLFAFQAQPWSRETGHWSLDVPSKTDWRPLKITFQLERKSGSAILMFHLAKKGRLWIDDVSLKEENSEENLIPNGDFEEWGGNPLVPEGWVWVREAGGEKWEGKVGKDEGERRSGNYSLLLENEGEGDIAHIQVQLPQKLEVSKRYVLSLWVKTDIEATGHPFFTRTLPAVLHNAFRSPRGEEAVILVNITDRPQRVWLEWRGKNFPLRLSPWEVRLVKEGDLMSKCSRVERW